MFSFSISGVASFSCSTQPELQNKFTFLGKYRHQHESKGMGECRKIVVHDVLRPQNRHKNYIFAVKVILLTYQEQPTTMSIRAFKYFFKRKPGLSLKRCSMVIVHYNTHLVSAFTTRESLLFGILLKQK